MFNDSVSPQDSSVVPQDDGATMFNDGVFPQDSSVVPQDDGATMFNDGVSPQDSNGVPQDDGATLFNDGVSPQDDSVLPQDDGAALFNGGVLPSIDNTAPTMFTEAPQDGMNSDWATSRSISPARRGLWVKRPKAEILCLNSSADEVDPLRVARTRKVWRMRISRNRGATGHANVAKCIICALARGVEGLGLIAVACWGQIFRQRRWPQ